MFPNGIEGGLEKGHLAFSCSNVSLVLGAIPFDFILENRPQEMADLSFVSGDGSQRNRCGLMITLHAHSRPEWLLITM